MHTFKLLEPEKPKAPEEVHARAMARGARCRECPLYGCERGPVLGEVRKNARMTIIGEAPGLHEVEEGRPFVGWSGGVLDTALRTVELDRAECTVTNVILCQPPMGFLEYEADLNYDWQRRVKRAEAAGLAPPLPPMLPTTACRPRLERDIRESDARMVLAVGKQALAAVAGHYGVAHGQQKARKGEPYIASMKRQHGAPVILKDPAGDTSKDVIIMASYHPAMAARRAREYLPVILDNLTRAARITKRDYRIEWSEPPFYTGLNATQIGNVCDQLRDLGAEITVDIESDSVDTHTCKVRCVGFGATVGSGTQEVVAVAPFRHMDGTAWWRDQDEMLQAARPLKALLDANPLAGQNFAFDSSVLLRVGLMSDPMKTWTDTMFLDHDTRSCDLPHDLGSITRRYFETPMWKVEVDHKSVNNVDDHDLQIYNGKDVLCTMRLLEPLRRNVAEHGGLPQYETDKALGPIIRNMGDLGIIVDEQKRGEFSASLNASCKRELEKFREISGKPRINPRSVKQLQDLFYRDWHYRPTIDTDGELIDEDSDDYDPEDPDGSTSSAALIELVKRGVDPRHKQAIDVLLDYRAFDKLRGTYVDNLRVRPVDWGSFGYCVGEVPPVFADVWDPKSEAFGRKQTLAARGALSVLNTRYALHVTPSGRLASSPNVQNIPALGKLNMRAMFVCPPGHSLVGADWATLEGRIYAVEAQDALLLQAIADGRDFHSTNAATMLAKDPSEIDFWYRRVEHGEGLDPSKHKKYRKYWRLVAKRVGFLILYGGEREKLFSVVSSQRDKATGTLSFPDLKRSDVERWYDNWHAMHPETRAWHERCHALQEQRGYAMVNGLDFRKRWFPGGVSQKNAVPNMSIQGKAGSIANRALRMLVERIPFRSWSPWTGVVLQVHDFLGVYVPDERAEEAAQILTECMFWHEAGVDFPADPCITKTWAEQD